MLTGKLRNQVDRTGGITNPISVIEQFSFLLFIRRLDDIHTLHEKAANAFGTPIENPIFNALPAELPLAQVQEHGPTAHVRAGARQGLPLHQDPAR